MFCIRRKGHPLRLILMLAVISGGAGSALSQETRGTILGSVKDPSGGLVPGVEVVVTNLDTNASQRTLTNDSGLFEVPLLMPGQYEVSAELQGFRKYVRRGMTLSTGSRVLVDIQLEIGQVTDAVTVTAEEPLLETTTASTGQTFDNRRIAELPILGNSVMLMAGLAFGMQRTGGYNYLGLHSTVGASDYRTAGGVGGNEWTLDGTPNTGHTRRAAYLPYTDGIDEFRIEATSFDASVGHTTGAYVTMQSKAGTNRYHGTVTESHWQQRWNATPNNDNGAYWSRIKQEEGRNPALAEQLKQQDRQPTGRSNNYAASVGGPVKIPKLYDGKDRLFFFFMFNGFKDNKTEEPGNKLFSVPTAEERQGNFSRLVAVNPARYQIYDPLTTRFNASTGLFERDPFPGNIIPSTRIVNPMYKFYEKFFPLPNNPPQMDAEGRNNYFNGAIPFNWDYKAVQNRIDYVHSEKSRFFGRWSYNKFVEDRNDWTYSTARFLHSNALHRINKGVGLDYVRSINPSTVLNIGLAYNRYFDNELRKEQLKLKPSDVGLPKYLDEKAGDRHSLPILDFDNSYRDVSSNVSRLQPISTGTLKADLMKYLGKHSLKMGWDGRMYYRVTGSPGNTSGNFSFRNNLFRRTSATTGVGDLGLQWAAFMMGIPSGMSVDTNDSSYITTPYHALFIQDNYRISSKLSVNLGLRMEYEGSIRERFDRGLRDFDFNAQVAIAAAAQAAYASDPGLAAIRAERPASEFVIRGGANYLGLNGAPRTRTDPTVRFMPRIGFAYSWDAKTVIKGGYGTFYDTLNVSHTTIDQSGYSRGTGTTITNDQGVSWNFGYFTNNNPPTTDPFPIRSDGTRFNVPLGNALGVNSFLGRGFTFLDPNYEPMKQHRWRLEIERQIGGSMVLGIAYTGSLVGNLTLRDPSFTRLNAIPERYWASGLVRNDAIANELNRNVSNPFYIGNFASLETSDAILYQQLSTLGFFTSRTISRAQLLRPFPHMSGGDGLRVDGAPNGKNSYHAMQARFDKRFSHGVIFNTHYEYSHTMSKDWFPNEFDQVPDWRESDNSRPHRWVGTAIYELPFGKGRWLLNRTGLLNALLGGWQVGLIWQVQSGECLDFGNLFYYGNDLRDITLPAGQRTKDHWFNTDNFEKSSSRAPSSFHRRVFPNRFNWLRTDRLEQIDMNLQKTFLITEQFKALFRVDLLNMPNSQTLGSPNTDPTSTSFGRITGYVNTPRYIQFQLRLTF